MSNQYSKWLILISVCLVLFLANVDFTAVNLALATIADNLHANLSQLQWIANGTSLSVACLLIVAGRVSDVFGRKTLYISGGVIFLISSFLCGIAQTSEQLILFRILLGVGSGLIFPTTSVLAYRSFPLEQKGFAIGLAAASIGFGQAIGPVVGGFILHYFSWRWIFFINIVPLIFSLYIMQRYHIKEEVSGGFWHIDWLGGIFLILAIFLIYYPLNNLTQDNIQAGKLLGSFVLGIILLLLFAWRQKTCLHPLIKLALFENKKVWKFILIRMDFQCVSFALPFILALYFQNALGYSVIDTGLIIMVETIIFALVSPFSGKLINRFNTEYLCSFGLVLCLFSCLLIFLGSYFHFFIIFSVVGMALFGVGFGVLQSTLTFGVLSSIPPEMNGIGSGLMLALAVLGGMAGIAISGLTYATISTLYFKSFLQDAHIILSTNQFQNLQLFVHGVRPLTQLPNYLAENHLPDVVMITKHALQIAFQINVLILSAILLMGLLFSFKKIRKWD